MFNSAKLVAGALAMSVVALAGAKADNLDRRIVLENRSHSTIAAFFASNTGTGIWDMDLLGNDFLPPAYRMTLDLDDGTGYCRFDFKTVFEDGSSVTRWNVNVCAVGRYSVYD